MLITSREIVAKPSPSRRHHISTHRRRAPKRKLGLMRPSMSRFSVKEIAGAADGRNSELAASGSSLQTQTPSNRNLQPIYNQQMGEA